MQSLSPRPNGSLGQVVALPAGKILVSKPLPTISRGASADRTRRAPGPVGGGGRARARQGGTPYPA
jgi:hypothetical protein